MSLKTFVTPKIRKGIVHIAILFIVIKTLIIPFIWNSDFPANDFNIYNTPILITFFYIHTFLLLPLFFKNNKPRKYFVLTIITFLIVYTAFCWIEAIRSSQIAHYYTNVNQDPHSWFINFLTRKRVLTIFGFSFAVFWLMSFIYYILIIKNTLRKEIFSFKYVELIVNLIVVGSFLFFIFLDQSYSTAVMATSLYLMVIILSFYINAFFITPKLIKEKNIDKYLLLIILFTFLFFGGIKLIYIITHIEISIFSNIITVTFLFLITYVLSFVYGFFRIRLKAKEQLFNLKLGAKDSELQLLKSQVNPHFLFNTLNTLYATSLEENAPKTAESTAKLANLLRYMQNDITKDFIPLANEIKYLEDYIAIQKLRCEIEPDVETDFMDIDDKVISPGLLIPFVENAFKYGIDPSKPSKLKVSVICGKNTIYFECTNSYDDTFKTYYKEQGFGIGITNTKQRLELVYPKKHTFEIVKENQLFMVKLEILSK